MQRAAGAARKLDEYLTSLKGTGVLREFTRSYKLRRKAAAANGHGFMSYQQALARLRNGLIPLLMNGSAALIQAATPPTTPSRPSIGRPTASMG
jgi:hypothetical protein